MSVSEHISAGARFRAALREERPLQIVGVINAYSAILAKRAGFRAIYLSGAGVANASRGLPDLGMTTLDDVLTDVRRITAACDLPLLVDIDTGWPSDEGVATTVKQMIGAGAAAVQMEDQVEAKRCGHRPGKAIVSTAEMVGRIRAAVSAKTDKEFGIMARTDALAVEGMDAAIERAKAYVKAGADMIFPEAMGELDQYRRFAEAVEVPILSNITEFGKTPLLTKEQLAGTGVRMVLYPLSAFRAMSAAALNVYRTIREDGTQKDVVKMMQTRDELYELLDYHRHEKAIDDRRRKESK